MEQGSTSLLGPNGGDNLVCLKGMYQTRKGFLGGPWAQQLLITGIITLLPIGGNPYKPILGDYK